MTHMCRSLYRAPITRLHTWPRGATVTPPPDFVPEPIYPEFMPPEDEILPAEEQPLPAAASPTTQSPNYVPESDPEEDPEEDDDEDPEEDPVDYPADGGDDEDESSEDNEDDDVDIEADDDEEKEEHPAPTDSTAIALPTIDQAPSAEETEPFEIDESAATPPPHPAYRVVRLLAISTPPSLPLSSWSSPLPQISSPPLLVSSPVPVLSPSPPTSPIRMLGYRATMIRLRAEAASTSHLLPLPPPIILSHTRPDALSSGIPHLHLLSTDHKVGRPEVTLPPRKRLGIALGPRYEVRESSSAAVARLAGGLRADYGFVATMDREIRRDLERDVGYRIIDTWDDMVEDLQGTPVVTEVAELSQRMIEFETRVRQDTDEVYIRLDDEQTGLGCPERLGDDPWTRVTLHVQRDVGGRSQEAEAIHRGTEADEETTDSDGRVTDMLMVRHSQIYRRRLVAVPRSCHG
ncbi:hypothetical protein Tco_1165177 [Tanacetum coccineum]